MSKVAANKSQGQWMSQDASQAGVMLTALCDSIRESVHHPKKNESQQRSPALFQIEGQIDERSRGQQDPCIRTEEKPTSRHGGVQATEMSGGRQ